MSSMFGKLYKAPAEMGDFCDSSGCLPGQIPLAGQKPHSILDKNADTTMEQVLFAARALSLAIRRARRRQEGKISLETSCAARAPCLNTVAVPPCAISHKTDANPRSTHKVKSAVISMNSPAGAVDRGMIVLRVARE